MESKPLFLAGPTASGKSEAALILAQRLGGEIISVDSMQVYRGMDIGTAKPSIEERARTPHHLIDVVGLNESFDAARFVQLAREAEGQIHARGAIPIFCGGTGLYFNALLRGLGEAPPADLLLRARLERTPLSDLLMELQRADPEAYQTVDRQNPRRVIRAVEVVRLTGKPFSAQRARWQSDGSGDSATPILYLTRGGADLRKRIDARVENMFHRGLVEETRQLLSRGLKENRTATQALGYRQVIEHLAGARDLAETIELVKVRTRQYAKRQGTWFRKQPGFRPVEVSPTESAGQIAERLEALYLESLSQR
ncbi:MAG TPA: tRNA (adenosine(37)-N6)-dimethylallyltransferase MiaA [Verrucomicrobiae bacterium]|nr:tRNA (adenosine(37)-N6)-dimethylallyltransferase MiaA [Verrucomicrobiae bacterium]